MKSIILVCFLLFPTLTQAQSVVGKWQTVDEKTKEARSIIELTSVNGTVTGKILQIFAPAGEDKDPVCDKCSTSDPRYMQKVIGMEIIRGLHGDGKQYVGGEILDPEDGKIYRLKIWLEGKNLMVRGYLGPFFRTQTWVPLN